MRNKYRAKKVKDGDLVFDSRKEYRRWQELLLMEKAGVIKGLRRQVKYELLPRVPGKWTRPVTYIADFVYYEGKKEIVEDVKGYRTDVYKLKKRLMWVVHGIEIRET